MASILEKLVSIYAPHSCIKCSVENNILCKACLYSEFDAVLEICYLCSAPCGDTGICVSCKKKANFHSVISGGEYEGTAKELIYMLKFGGVKEAAVALAMMLDAIAPHFPAESVVMPVPTAPKRVRMRGYDHAVIIAKTFAQLRQYRYESLLFRRTNTRQLGSTRHQRQVRSEEMFYTQKPRKVKSIILIDDVITTGATMDAAAATCGELNPENIFGLTVAKHSI